MTMKLQKLNHIKIIEKKKSYRRQVITLYYNKEERLKMTCQKLPLGNYELCA